MTIDILREALGWCAVINIGLLLLWFLFFAFAHNLIYRKHSKWFKIPVETFNTIHYAGIAFYKIAILVFNVIPYFVLRIVG
ncbi:hypothetical protein KAI19_03245 [bacterium]|nr:hypothetical protein [bacterium]